MAGRGQLLNFLVATARRKLAAAQARHGSPMSDEKPKDAVLEAISIIGNDVIPEGFRFLKSGSKFKKESGDLTFEIIFQSDRHNIAGVRAAVWIHAAVYSRRLKVWREGQTQPFLHREGAFAGHVVGAQIGNLTPRLDWKEWDFADKASRARVAQDAAGAIREIIFPFFAAFERPETVLPLVNQMVVGQSSLVEYLLVVAGLDTASKAGASYLAAHPPIKRRFERALLELSQKNAVGPQGDIARDLAALSVATGLRFSA